MMYSQSWGEKEHIKQNLDWGFVSFKEYKKPKINVRVHCRHSINVETHPLEKGLSKGTP